MGATGSHGGQSIIRLGGSAEGACAGAGDASSKYLFRSEKMDDNPSVEDELKDRHEDGEEEEEDVWDKSETVTKDNKGKRIASDGHNDIDEIGFPILVSSGFKPRRFCFVQESFKHIIEQKIGLEVLSNGFVLELYSMVEPTKLGSSISPGKISTRGFSEIIACLVLRWSPDKVTNSFVKRYAYRRDLQSLKEKVESGTLSEIGQWPACQKLLNSFGEKIREDPVDKSEKSEDIGPEQPNIHFENATPSHASKEQEQSEDKTSEVEQDQTCPYLAAQGLICQDNPDPEDLLRRLALWLPSKEGLSNGLVLEIAALQDSQLQNVLKEKLYQYLNIQPRHQKSHNLKKPFYNYIKRTSSSTFKPQLDHPWMYLELLEEGGKLFKPELRKSPSKFDQVLSNLNEALETNEVMKSCSNCSSVGDHFCCQGCFSVFYCSINCQTLDWEKLHSDECSTFSKKMLGDGLRLPPEKTFQNIYKNTLKLNERLAQKNLDLKTCCLDLEAKNKYLLDENNKLSVELMIVKEALDKAKKEKAGKSSAFVKLKRKFDDIDSDSDDEDADTKSSKTQTAISLVKDDVNIMEIRQDISTNIHNLDIFSAKDLKTEGVRSYGESTFVRIPSSRKTIWPNDQVGSRAVQMRAKMSKEFISLVSGASSVSEERSEKVEKMLYIELVKQNKEVFIDLLRNNTEVLNNVMKMSPAETSMFMHSANSSYNQKRKMATMLTKVFKFNPLFSEKRQRECEKPKKSLVERNKLDHGSMLLHKIARSEYATLCAFVRVTELAEFVSELVSLSLAQELTDLSSMKNLAHPLYFGKLWIVLGGDKGNSTMKFVAGVGGCNPHLFAMFEASDTPSNLLAFQSIYVEQIRRMICFGVEVQLEDGSSKVYEVGLFSSGDKAYLSDQNGHAGGASSYPSLYRLVTSSHLRKKHLDGSPHTRGNPDCEFLTRTPDSADKDYHENVTDKRPGTTRTRGKYHNSIVGP